MGINYGVAQKAQQTYSEKYNLYQQAIDAYNEKLKVYRGDISNYNDKVAAWNAGPRTSPFTVPKPIEPSQRQVTTAEGIAEQANPRFTVDQQQMLSGNAQVSPAQIQEKGLIQSMRERAMPQTQTSISEFLTQARNPRSNDYGY